MNTSTLKEPAIVRIWRGRTPRDRADEYEEIPYRTPEGGADPAPPQEPWRNWLCGSPQRKKFGF
jgi:hypothetical protein